MNRQRQWLFEAPLTSNFNWQIDRELGSLNENASFASSFKITTRLPESRKFTVSTGTVSVTSSAGWDRPSACPIRQYQIRLWKSGRVYDDDLGAFTFAIGGSATATWTNLSPGEYYLEITVNNGNPSCFLLGNITVT
jgi:hypothetical protein